jgi:hypothetical protein
MPRWLYGLALLLCAGPAVAQHVDITFALDGGSVVTGAFDFTSPSDPIVPGVRVFARDLDTVAAVYTSADPGFTTAGAAQLAPHSLAPFPDGDLTLRILSVRTPAEPLGANLLYWDGLDADADGSTGVEDVAFGVVPNGEVLEIRQTGCFGCITITADGGAADVPFRDGAASPFVVASQAPGSGIHKHLDFSLIGDGVRPTEGIYLLGLASDGMGATAAEPYYLIFHAPHFSMPGFGADAKSAARAWVEANLAATGSAAEDDLAIVAVKAPARLAVGSARPPKPLRLSLQNRGETSVSIIDADQLEALLIVELVSRAATCASDLPSHAVAPPKGGFPFEWAPGKKLSLALAIDWDCVNDPAASTKSDDHGDFTLAVRVDAAALGLFDANDSNDVCPRSPGSSDKGCGKRNDPFPIDLVIE